MLQLVDKLAISLDIIMFEINACVAGFSLDTVSWLYLYLSPALHLCMGQGATNITSTSKSHIPYLLKHLFSFAKRSVQN